MKISRKHLWLMRMMKKRAVTDTMSWILFFFFSLSFCFSYAFFELSNGPDSKTLEIYFDCNGKDWFCMLQSAVLNTLLFTLVMMVPGYINLFVLKEKILDKKIFGPYKYSLYILSVGVLASIIALVLRAFHDVQIIPGWHIIEINSAIIVSAVFFVAFMSTGLIYLKELLVSRYQLEQMEREKDRLEKEIERLEHERINIQKIVDEKINAIEKDRIRVGSKGNWDLIRFNEILFLKGDGNAPVFRLIDGRTIRGNKRLEDYGKLLPPHLFIRVHRSYIVSLDKIIRTRSNRRRKKECCKLRDYKIEIPIGRTYRSDLERALSFFSSSEIETIHLVCSES